MAPEAAEWSPSTASRDMTAEFAGQTFATIGLTPGTYAWTWGSGIDADSFTIEIGPLFRSPPQFCRSGSGSSVSPRCAAGAPSRDAGRTC
jgi:hypothetical protein